MSPEQYFHKICIADFGYTLDELHAMILLVCGPKPILGPREAWDGVFNQARVEWRTNANKLLARTAKPEHYVRALKYKHLLVEYMFNENAYTPPEFRPHDVDHYMRYVRHLRDLRGH